MYASRVLGVGLVFVMWLASSLVAQVEEKKPAKPPGHADLITSIAWSQDGRTVASAGFDNTVQLWDVANGKNIAVLDVAGAHAVAFSPTLDRKVLASCSSGGFGVKGLRGEGVRLFDVDDDIGKITAKLDPSGVHAIAFSPDGATLACVRESVKGHATNPVISLWKVDTGKNFFTLNVADHKRYMVSAIAFSPDGKSLASGGSSWDVTLKEQTFDMQLWDAANGKLRRTFTGHTGHVLSVAFNSDNKILASAGNDTTVRLWDLATGKTVATLAGHSEPVYCVTFGVDGKTLASAGDRSIILWDVASGKKARTLQSGYVRAVAFSPDGKMLASGVGEGMGKQNVIKLWDVASGKHTRTLP